jgi:hypothetical protein
LRLLLLLSASLSSRAIRAPAADSAVEECAARSAESEIGERARRASALQSPPAAAARGIARFCGAPRETHTRKSHMHESQFKQRVARALEPRVGVQRRRGRRARPRDERQVGGDRGAEAAGVLLGGDDGGVLFVGVLEVLGGVWRVKGFGKGSG